MDENLGQDLELSHSVLNYVNACYQGDFASLNMLSQLGFHEFNPDELSTCQAELTYLERLMGQLGQGIPVFSRSWKVAQTSDAKETLAVVERLKVARVAYAVKIEKMLALENPFQSIEDVKFLIAAYCRFAYTNENYIRGYIAFGESFTVPELVQAYSSILPQAEKNIEAAHLFFDIFTGDEQIPEVFYRSLFEEGLFLPGIFRTNAHDLSRFAATYKGPFTFEHTDIPLQLAEEWAVINIDANVAGYWHAYHFTARDMADWVQVGITVPRNAWFWRCVGFDAQGAEGWSRAGFPPPLAQSWVAAGFTAEEAIDHIKRGFTNPQTAREDSRKIIDE